MISIKPQDSRDYFRDYFRDSLKPQDYFDQVLGLFLEIISRDSLKPLYYLYYLRVICVNNMIRLSEKTPLVCSTIIFDVALLIIFPTFLWLSWPTIAPVSVFTFLILCHTAIAVCRYGVQNCQRRQPLKSLLFSLPKQSTPGYQVKRYTVSAPLRF